MNNFLFIEDLKLYAKNERELDSLIQTVKIFSDDVGIVFSMDKCAMLVLKKRKMVQKEGIELPDGKRMREVNLDECKYLGVLQLDFIINREIKEKVKSKCIRRVKKLLRSHLNGENVTTVMKARAVGIIRYEAGVLDWTEEELKSIDIRTRKLMTMNGSLHSRGNVGRLCLTRNERRRELLSCE